jgi:hypothetical protein
MDRGSRTGGSPAGRGQDGRRPALTTGPGWVERLERWAADAHVDEAARRRARERWLRHQAEEDGSFGGVLVDLADAGGPVLVDLQGGTQVTGVVRAVGADVVTFEPAAPGSGPVVVAVAAITAVRSGAGTRPVAGDRTVPSALRLDDVLVELAAEGERVRLVTVAGGVVGGCVRAVGRDVVTLAALGPTDGPGQTYVPRAAVAAVTIAP